MPKDLTDAKRTPRSAILDYHSGTPGLNEAELLDLFVRDRSTCGKSNDVLAEAFEVERDDESHRSLDLSKRSSALQACDGRFDAVALSHHPRQRAAGRISESFGARRDRHSVSDLSGNPPPRGKIPVPQMPLIGRAREMEALRRAMLSGQCVTVIGVDGIGKTRLAIELAQASVFADGVYWISLETLSKPQAMLDAVGIALCGRLSAERGVLAQLKIEFAGREMLVVLDGVDGSPLTAAELAEALLDASEDIRVLATARKPLKTPHETVLHLAALDVPPISASNGEILDSAAVRLLVAAIRAAGARFATVDHDLKELATLCRDLGGIPLAIELAAALVGASGRVDCLVADRDDSLTAKAGHASSKSLHDGLAKLFDMNVDALDDSARLALPWLAVFEEGFSVEGACHVLAAAGLDSSRAAQVLADLLARSLTVRDVSAPTPRYRFRSALFRRASVMLDHAGDRPGAIKAHATYLCIRFDRTRGYWSDSPITEWLREFQRELGALRAAFAWALSASGDAGLAVRLAVVAVPYLFELSLVDECRKFASDALHVLDSGKHNLGEILQERLQLGAALGASLVYTDGPRESAVAAWQKVLALAVRTGDREFELRALWGLWIIHHYRGEIHELLDCADRFRKLCGEGPNGPLSLIGARMRGIALHYAGRQQEARDCLEQTLAADASEHLRWNIVGLRSEWRLGSLAVLARVSWLQGDVDKALRIASSALQMALQHENSISTCYVLAESLLPIAILSNEFEAAHRALSTLVDVSSRFELSSWLSCARVYEECLRLAEAGNAGDSSPAATIFGLPRDCGNFSAFVCLTGQLVRSMMAAGRHNEAMAIVREALARAEESGERWYAAELMRLKGELLVRANRIADAACFFSIAQDEAAIQAAYLISRRAAVSLATVWRDQGRTDLAINSRESLGDCAAGPMQLGS
jgi:predicted ATPase